MVREKKIYDGQKLASAKQSDCKKRAKKSKKRSRETEKKPSKTKQDQVNNKRLAQIAFIMQTNYTYILAGASEIVRQDTVHDSYRM